MREDAKNTKIGILEVQMKKRDTKYADQQDNETNIMAKEHDFNQEFTNTSCIRL